MNDAPRTHVPLRILIQMLGGLTILIGIGYSFFGAVFVYGGNALAQDDSDWKALLDLLAFVMFAVGAIGLCIGILVAFVGVGLLRCKTWARWLAYPIAILLISCLGYLFVSGPDPGPGASWIGGIQLAYGPLAFAALIAYSARR